MKRYPLLDRPTPAEAKALGFTGPFSYWSPAREMAAEPTGEMRPPRAGEWYLSGAVVEAYRALKDFSSPYQIARLVRA